MRAEHLPRPGGSKRRRGPVLGELRRRGAAALVLALVVLGADSGAADLEVGSPFIDVFLPNEYGAHAQNWAVVQDQRGVMYFGNTAGVLEFDGVSWDLITMPNESIVRSLAVDAGGTVWVGAVGELGFLNPDAGGKARYTSLVSRLDEQDQDLSDVWWSAATDEGVFFVTRSKLLRWRAGEFFSWEVVSEKAPSVVDSKVVINERGRGLMVVDGDELRLLPGGEGLASHEVVTVLRYSDETVLIGTRPGELFLFDLRWPGDDDPLEVMQRPMRRLPSAADSILSRHKLYHAIRLPGGDFAMATMTGGAVVISANGDLVLAADQSIGLPDLSVWSLFVDSQHGLWLSMNRGLARLETESPVRPITESSGLQGTVEAIVRHDGVLFVGTSTGLYELDGRRFRKLESVQAPCWDLLSFVDSTDGAGRLLVGAYGGVYELRDGGVALLQEATNAFELHRSTRDPSIVFVGDALGLLVLRRRGEGWLTIGRVPGIGDEIRSIAEDDGGGLWLGTYFDGLLHVELGEDLRPGEVLRFGIEHGLSTLREVRVVPSPGGLLFASPEGLLELDGEERFRPSHAFGSDLADGSLGIYRAVADTSGSLWLSLYSKTPLVARLQPDASYRLEEPGLQRLPTVDVSAILPEGDGVVWIGCPDGLFRFDSGASRYHGNRPRALIRKVTAGRETTRVLDILSPLLTSEAAVGRRAAKAPAPPALAYDENSLVFHFASPSFDDIAANRYRFRLDGWEGGWSSWVADTKKEYTNLREGEYRFRVQARDLYQAVSDEAVYAFAVRPPLHRTTAAYLLYIVAGLLLVSGIVRLRSANLVRQRDRLEQLVDERTSELTVRKDHLETINNIVASINSEIDFDDLMRAILDQVKVIDGLEGACFLVRQSGTRRLRVRAVSESLGPVLEDVELYFDELRASLLSRAEEIDPDIFVTRPRSDLASQDAGGVGFKAPRSMLVMAFRVEGEVESALALVNSRVDHAFDDNDVDLLRNLKDHILAAFLKARLLQEVQNLSDRKSEVLRIAAHDVRSPLANIIGFLQVMAKKMRDGRFDPEAGALRIDSLIASGEQTIAMLERLLDLSAIESGKEDLALATVQMRPLLEECEAMHREAAQRKEIEITVKGSRGCPPVAGDPERITQVLDNLVGNAIKYTHPGGSVVLSCETGDEEVVTRVEDSGQGLSAADKEHVFRSFKRLSATPTGGETSTGLGLAIARSIVERHGGRIWVDSVHGRGSTFSFSLPAIERQ